MEARPTHRNKRRWTATALLFLVYQLTIGVWVWAPVAATTGDGTWIIQNPPNGSVTKARLTAISCANEMECLAVGWGGVFVKTANGGASWTSGRIASSDGSSSAGDLWGVSCPETNTCFSAPILPAGNIVWRTGDGGASWQGTAAPETQEVVAQPRGVKAIACTSITNCSAAGSDRWISTTDGGNTWADKTVVPQIAGIASMDCPSPGPTCYAGGSNSQIFKSDGTNGLVVPTRTQPGQKNFQGISCVDPVTCVAVDKSGAIIATADGGNSWADSATITGSLAAVKCVLVDSSESERDLECTVVGSRNGSTTNLILSGHIKLTAVQNLGFSTIATGTWTQQQPGPDVFLTGVACPALRVCYAVGDKGTILKTAPRPAPTLSVAPNSYDFGKISVGTTSVAQEFQISNPGSSAVTVKITTLTGSDRGDFGLVPGRNHCKDASLAPGAQCTLAVTFTSSSVGPRSAALSVTTDNPETAPLNVPVSGTGIRTGVRVTPSAIDFGNQQVGTQSAAKSVTLVNDGDSDVVVVDTSITGQNPTDFDAPSKTNFCEGQRVGQGESCNLEVRFAPLDMGPRSALLSISDDAPGSPHRIELSGVGLPPTSAPSAGGDGALPSLADSAAPVCGDSATASVSRKSVAFEANSGQTDASVRFIARSAGQTTFFTGSGLTMSLAAGQPLGAPDSQSARLSFLGAQNSPEIEPEEALPGRVNYFVGADPSKWLTSIPTYSSIQYRKLYPGIDLRYEGTDGSLKGTWTVAPGAHPADIAWRYEGVRNVARAESGDLKVTLQGSYGNVLVEKAPVAWQETKAGRRQVQVQYALSPSGVVRFKIGNFDSALPLIIDPKLVYSTYLGGNSGNYEQGWGIAVDDDCDVYLAGRTSSVTFPTSAGVVEPTPPPGSLLGGLGYITKLRPAGNGARDLVWSTFIGGTGIDYVTSVATDRDHNVFATGIASGNGFPTSDNAFQRNNAGGGLKDDAFVLKLNPTASRLLYSTYLGGSGTETGQDSLFGGGLLPDYHAPNDIAVDSSGHAFVSGGTTSCDFPVTSGALQRKSVPASNGQCSAGYLTKFSPDGSRVDFSTYLPSGVDSIAVGPDEKAFITGATSLSSFPTTPRAAQRSFAGPNQVNPAAYGDAYVAKLNAMGTAFDWATYLGGSGSEDGRGIAVDSSGNVFVAGLTSSKDFPGTGPNSARQAKSSDPNDYDAFVARLTSDGSAITYSSYLGGSSSDIANSIALDSGGQAYITGTTSSCDFWTVDPIQARPAAGNNGDALPQSLQPCTPGDELVRSGPNSLRDLTAPGAPRDARYDALPDAFVAKVDTSKSGGRSLNWSTYLGGEFRDFGNAIAVDRKGNAHVIGTTQSEDFPIAPKPAGTFDASDPACSVQKGSLPFQPINHQVGDIASQSFMSTIGDDDLGPAPPGCGARGRSALQVIAPPPVQEPVSGTISEAVFEVVLAAIRPSAVHVDYETFDGSARAGSDYDAASGQLTFAPGETSKHVTVLVRSDDVAEPSETFSLAVASSDLSAAQMPITASADAVIVDGTGSRRGGTGKESASNPADSQNTALANRDTQQGANLPRLRSIETQTAVKPHLLATLQPQSIAQPQLHAQGESPAEAHTQAGIQVVVPMMDLDKNKQKQFEQATTNNPSARPQHLASALLRSGAFMNAALIAMSGLLLFRRSKSRHFQTASNHLTKSATGSQRRGMPHKMPAHRSRSRF